MPDSPSVPYTQLDAALTASGMPCSAAETHGTLTGVLCANPNADLRQGLDALSVYVESAGGFQTASLNDVFVATARDLTDEQFRFSLLLPDDETALPERAEALANWCQGFLYGFGAIGSKSLPKQTLEILRDLTEISQLDLRVEGEEDERAFAELVEFVRVGVQLVFADSLLNLIREKQHDK